LLCDIYYIDVEASGDWNILLLSFYLTGREHSFEVIQDNVVIYLNLSSDKREVFVDLDSRCCLYTIKQPYIQVINVYIHIRRERG